MDKPLLESKVCFSHGHFLVYDLGVLNDVAPLPTDDHYRQGFARRQSTVAFGTLVQFGIAEVTVFSNVLPELNRADRAIAVPFRAITGTIAIEGPVESNPNRVIHIAPGEYRLVAAQRIVAPPAMWDEEPEIAIRLSFERLDESLAHSSILIADEQLSNPPDPLVEDSEIAWLSSATP